MNQKHIMMIAVILLGLCSTAPAWGAAGWDHRIELQINNTGGNALEYYQVCVNLTDNPINSTSLRVANETAGVFVPHWQETVSSGNCTKLWFNATAISASSWLNATYYVYSGNDTASSTSDINSTMVFGDDFNRADSGTVGHGWYAPAGTWSISNNTLKCADVVGDINHNFSCAVPYIISCNVSRTMTLRESTISLYELNLTHWCSFQFYAGAIKYVNSAGWQSTGESFSGATWYEVEFIYYPATGKVDYALPLQSWSALDVTPYTYTGADRLQFAAGSSGSASHEAFYDTAIVRKYVSVEPNVICSTPTTATPVISSPAPGTADTKYVSNRSVTYSACVSPVANCKWAYQNGTFIEWDNTTATPSVVRWINRSGTSEFNISLVAYAIGNSSNHTSETWNNTIIDDVFDYTNYTWERLHVWNEEMIVGAGGNIEFGDVDNDGATEMILVESPSYIDSVKDIIIYKLDDYSSKTYPSATSDTKGFVEASVHDVDQDGVNELFCMYGDAADARVDLFRFNTTHLNGSNMHKDIMESGSNNPKSFSWINISDQEHFYCTGCGNGETTDVFLNLTSFSTHEIDDFIISGEDNVAWDIDGDGDLELLVIEGYSANSAKVWLYELNYATGAYTSKTMLFDNDLKSAQHYTANMIVGDVDNDGIDNLIIFWTPTADPDLRISEVEAYEFDGIVHFGEGNYSEGFAIETCDNHELGVTCGHGKYFVGDIDHDELNEFVTGHYVYTGAYQYNTVCYVYDVPSGGSGISKHKLVDFPVWYLTPTTYFIHAAVVGLYAGKCYMTVGSDSEVDGAYRTELFVLESRTPYKSNISIGANQHGLLRKNVTSAETFSEIAAGIEHDRCYTWWNSTNDLWESYTVGRSYNSGKSVPEHDSYFVLMDATGTTITCTGATAETIAIPTGWYATYLRESTNKTLTAIKADMGGNCHDLYAFNSTAGAWTDTSTYSVQSNQGLLINASAGFNWDGAVP